MHLGFEEHSADQGSHLDNGRGGEDRLRSTRHVLGPEARGEVRHRLRGHAGRCKFCIRTNYYPDCLASEEGTCSFCVRTSCYGCPERASRNSYYSCPVYYSCPGCCGRTKPHNGKHMSIYIELKSCTLIQSRLCTVAAAAVDGYTGKRAGPTPHVYAGGRPSLSRAGELHPTPSWVHGWGGPLTPPSNQKIRSDQNQRRFEV